MYKIMTAGPTPVSYTHLKAALYFQGHKRVILNVLLMTFVQRGCLFRCV